MKYLIIYAHPDTESHAKFTLEEIESRLKELKRDYEIIDLYKINYDPVLSIREITEKGYAPEIVLEHRKKIDNADILVFIYPVWWNSMPAILKGWLDRTLSAGYAFKYINRIPKGLLNNKRAIIFATTGANRFLSCMFQGLRWKKIMAKDTLGFCGIKTKTYHLGNAYKLTEKNKKKIINNIKKAFK
ncbi:MAG: NAD(P)H-dependent oxidoreductase [Candidatus Woesearchaeota archaeon]